MVKRLFDVVAAAIGLLILSPILMGIALLVKLSSPGPVIFRQERVGRRLRRFSLLKFRTMLENAPRLGGQITVADDPRITKIGSILRRTKCDELPQLLNVITGHMSIVGPRPEVPAYVDMYPHEFETILTVRPGLTDLASLKYRKESEILSRSANPENVYATVILPDKLRLAKEYVNRQSFWLDLRIILRTIFHLP